MRFVRSNNALISAALHELIAAPVLAVIEADYMAARAFVRYIGEYGFGGQDHGASHPGSGAAATPDGFVGELRMVSFRVDQTESDGRVRSRLVRLPALSLIPLPLLKVKEANFSFSVRILDGVTEAPKGPLRLLGGGREDEPHGPEPPRWRAMFVPDEPRDGESPGWGQGLQANMDVKISVTQSDLTAGIVRLLSVMNESAQVVSGSIRLSAARVRLAAGESATLTLQVFDFRGDPARGAAVRWDSTPGAGIQLAGNGAPWPEGREVEADSSGAVEVRVLLPKGAAGTAEEIEVRFTAVVDGVTVSESLRVRAGS